MEKSRVTHCINCGAPALTEVCHYCKKPSGLEKNSVELEYQVIECNEINYNFLFLIPFFGILLFVFLAGIFYITQDLNSTAIKTFVIGTTLIISFFWIIIVSIPTKKLIDILLKGKEIEAVVYGYLDDIYTINDVPQQIVKLLVETNDGPKYILYQLGTTSKNYEINQKIKLKAYKDMFKIIK